MADIFFSDEAIRFFGETGDEKIQKYIRMTLDAADMLRDMTRERSHSSFTPRKTTDSKFSLPAKSARRRGGAITEEARRRSSRMT